MNLLFITEQFPWPLNNGGNLRTFHILKSLACEHSVTLLSHEVNRDAKQALDQIRALGIRVVTVRERPALRRALGNVIRTGLIGRPLWLVKNRSHELYLTTKRLMDSQTFDAVHLNMLDTACFVEEIRFSCPVVFDSHNCLTFLAEQTARDHRHWWMRRVFAREAKALAEVEGQVAAGVSSTLVCSELDAVRFGSLARDFGESSDVRAVLVSNGVDLEHYSMDDYKDVSEQALVFVGAMDYFPNIQAVEWFCSSIWPLIQHKLPACKVYLTGKDPTPNVKRLATENIIVTGSVADVRPFVGRSRMFVVPLLSGGGTRLKILTAMAAKRPIVSTTIGAEGLGLVDGEHLLIADTVQEFADAVERLWYDPMLSRRLVDNAYRKVVDKFSWDVVSNKLLAEYRTLLGSPKEKTVSVATRGVTQ